MTGSPNWAPKQYPMSGLLFRMDGRTLHKKTDIFNMENIRIPGMKTELDRKEAYCLVVRIFCVLQHSAVPKNKH